MAICTSCSQNFHPAGGLLAKRESICASCKKKLEEGSDKESRDLESRQRRKREATQFASSLEEIMESVLPSLRTCIVQMSAALEYTRGIDYERLSQSLAHPMRLTKISELMDLVEVARGILMGENRDESIMKRYKAMLHRYATVRTCVETLLDLIDPMRMAARPWLECVKQSVCFDDLDEDVKSRLMICYQQICFDLSWKGIESSKEGRTHSISREHALAMEAAFFKAWNTQRFLCWSLLTIFEAPTQDYRNEDLQSIFAERVIQLGKADPAVLRSVFGNDLDGRLSAVILKLTRHREGGEKLVALSLTILSQFQLDAFKELCVYPFEKILNAGENFPLSLAFIDELLFLSQNPEIRAILASERLKLLHRQMAAMQLKQNTDFNFKGVGLLNAEMEKICLSELEKINLPEQDAKAIFIRLDYSKPKEKPQIYNLHALQIDEKLRLDFATVLCTLDKERLGMSLCMEIFKSMEDISQSKGLLAQIIARTLVSLVCFGLALKADKALSWIFLPMAFIAFYAVPSKIIFYSKRTSVQKIQNGFLAHLLEPAKRIAAMKEATFEGVMGEFRKKDEEIEELKSMISAYERDGSIPHHVA